MTHVAAHRRLLIGAVCAALPLLLAATGQRRAEDGGRSLSACVETCVAAGTPREACLDRCRCFEKCIASGERTAGCQGRCGMAADPAPTGADPAATGADTPAPGRGLLSGTYTCPTCPRPQTWRIADRLLHWEGRPYVPVAGFIVNPNHPPDITEFRIAIDGDFPDVGETERQYFDRLDRQTSQISADGKTYVLLVNYPQPPRVANWLADANAVTRMTAMWRRLAPRVRKPGLRAIWLFDEINWEWQWPRDRSPTQYGALLRRMADHGQQIFGEVPIFFKTAAAGGGFANVMAGAALASGFGFDVYPRRCSAADGFEQEVTADLGTLRRAAPKSLGLVWAAEFGKRSHRTEEQLRNLPLLAGYEAFASKAEVQCYVDRLLAEGMTGFFHGPPVTRDSYQWYAELKPYVQQQVRARQVRAASPSERP